MNLEEPAAFNDQVERFLHAVELGKWGPRDPRAQGNAPMPTKGRGLKLSPCPDARIADSVRSSNGPAPS